MENLQQPKIQQHAKQNANETAEEMGSVIERQVQNL
jgi:hypothetical protein